MSSPSLKQPPQSQSTQKSNLKRFIDQETTFEGKFSRNVFHTIWMAYSPYRVSLSFYFLMGFIGRALLMANANLIGFWADSFCKEPSSCRPIPSFLKGFTSQDYLWSLLFVTVLGFIFTLLFRLAFSRTSSQAISQFYDEVTYRTSRFPMKFFDTTPGGRIITRFSSDYGAVFRIFGGPLSEFSCIVFDLIATFILVTYASPYFLPLFLGITGLNYIVYRLNRDRIRKQRRALSRSRSPAIAHFAETAQGATTIRMFARQKVFFDRFRNLNDHYLWERLRTFRVSLGFSFEMSVLTAALLLLTGLLGYFMVQSNKVSVGAIGVAFTFVTLAGTSLQLFFEWIAQLEEAMTGVERLDQYLRAPLEPGSHLPPQAQFQTGHLQDAITVKKQSTQRNAPVEVKDLWFRYGADLPYVLKGLSFTLKPGEHLGVIGRTGSGKSSLVQALFRFYPIDEGEISIDRVSPKFGDRTLESSQVDLRHYRQRMAFISQEPTLFRGSLRENLTMDPDCDSQRVLEAIHRVGLQQWYSHQPHGLETQIEERGRNLSLGERQLLCVARCLLQDAPIVIMDEATSSIDPQSEEILVRATNEFFKERTQIIIAHRLSTLKSCDRILWLKDGKAEMLGTPNEVLPQFLARE